MAERIADDFTAIARRLYEIKNPPHVTPLPPLPLVRGPGQPAPVRCIRCDDKQVVVDINGTMQQCPDCNPAAQQHQAYAKASAQLQATVKRRRP